MLGVGGQPPTSHGAQQQTQGQRHCYLFVEIKCLSSWTTKSLFMDGVADKICQVWDERWNAKIVSDWIKQDTISPNLGEYPPSQNMIMHKCCRTLFPSLSSRSQAPYWQAQWSPIWVLIAAFFSLTTGPCLCTSKRWYRKCSHKPVAEKLSIMQPLHDKKLMLSTL